MDVFVRVSYLQKSLEEGVGTISLIWGILPYTHPFMGHFIEWELEEAIPDDVWESTN